MREKLEKLSRKNADEFKEIPIWRIASLHGDANYEVRSHVENCTFL